MTNVPLTDNAKTAAVAWLSSQPGPIPHAVRVLKQMFGLTAKDACEAIATARGKESGVAHD